MKTIIQFKAYDIVFQVDINCYEQWSDMKRYGWFKPANENARVAVHRAIVPEVIPLWRRVLFGMLLQRKN